MLDDAYLAERAKTDRPARATHFAAGRPHSGGTIYLSAADERGMMVSFIQSNYMGFGSAVVPGTGIALQNRARLRWIRLRRTSSRAASGRSTRSSRRSSPRRSKAGPRPMSFGVGGDMQPQGTCRPSCGCSAAGSNRRRPDAPRWKVNRDFTLDVEAICIARPSMGWPHAAIRSSRSTILTWISVRGSSSGVSIATIASVATWPRATAARRSGGRFLTDSRRLRRHVVCFAGGRMAAVSLRQAVSPRGRKRFEGLV